MIIIIQLSTAMYTNIFLFHRIQDRLGIQLARVWEPKGEHCGNKAGGRISVYISLEKQIVALTQ